MIERIKNIWTLTYDEMMHKVSWPTWDELVESTIIVLIASIIFAFVILIMDKSFDAITGFIYGLL